MILCRYFCFFFKQKTAYEMRISDWSSDVCSSDLDLVDMTGMLEIAGTLEKLRDELSPKPVGKLLDDQVTAIKETYAELSTSGTGLPGYMIAFVIARLTDGFQLLPICDGLGRSEEHTSELQALMRISYAVFCLKKKK